MKFLSIFILSIAMLAISVSAKPDFCTLPLGNSGGPNERCRGAIPSYHYDLINDSCSFFLYNGCGGNANRFPSIEDCERTCKFA